MGKVSKKTLVAAIAAIVGSKVNTTEPIEPKQFLDSQRDLTFKNKKPVNGYQANQRKRKLKRRGGN